MILLFSTEDDTIIVNETVINSNPTCDVETPVAKLGHPTDDNDEVDFDTVLNILQSSR